MKIAGFFTRSRLRWRDPKDNYRDGHSKNTARAVQREETSGCSDCRSGSADKSGPHRLGREASQRTARQKKYERSGTAGSIQENEVVLGGAPLSGWHTANASEQRRPAG